GERAYHRYRRSCSIGGWLAPSGRRAIGAGRTDGVGDRMPGDELEVLVAAIVLAVLGDKHALRKRWPEAGAGRVDAVCPRHSVDAVRIRFTSFVIILTMTCYDRCSAR